MIHPRARGEGGTASGGKGQQLRLTAQTAPERDFGRGSRCGAAWSVSQGCPNHKLGSVK